MRVTLTRAMAFCALLSPMIVVAADAPDGKVIQSIRWSDVPLPKGGGLVGAGAKTGEILALVHGEEKPVLYPLLKLDKPALQTKAYAVRCEIRYTDVVGNGYLEMWSVFPPDRPEDGDARYFSRTMGTVGPMSKLTGSSDWREAMLPFNATGSKGQPTRLEVNLFLPGKGRVEIRNVSLVAFSDPREMFSSLERAAAAMLAPSAAGAGETPPSSTWIRQHFLVAIFAPVAVTVAVAAIWRAKNRRDAERRRMQALDVL